MTPEHLTGLGALLIEFREWLDERDPGCLDAALVDEVVTVVAAARHKLVTEGAR